MMECVRQRSFEILRNLSLGVALSDTDIDCLATVNDMIATESGLSGFTLEPVPFPITCLHEDAGRAESKSQSSQVYGTSLQVKTVERILGADSVKSKDEPVLRCTPQSKYGELFLTEEEITALNLELVLKKNSDSTFFQFQLAPNQPVKKQSLPKQYSSRDVRRVPPSAEGQPTFESPKNALSARVRKRREFLRQKRLETKVETPQVPDNRDKKRGDQHSQSLVNKSSRSEKSHSLVSQRTKVRERSAPISKNVDDDAVSIHSQLLEIIKNQQSENRKLQKRMDMLENMSRASTVSPSKKKKKKRGKRKKMETDSSDESESSSSSDSDEEPKVKKFHSKSKRSKRSVPKKRREQKKNGPPDASTPVKSSGKIPIAIEPIDKRQLDEIDLFFSEIATDDQNSHIIDNILHIGMNGEEDVEVDVTQFSPQIQHELLAYVRAETAAHRAKIKQERANAEERELLRMRDMARMEVQEQRVGS